LNDTITIKVKQAKNKSSLERHHNYKGKTSKKQKYPLTDTITIKVKHFACFTFIVMVSFKGTFVFCLFYLYSYGVVQEFEALGAVVKEISLLTIKVKQANNKSSDNTGLGLWCLTQLSTMFQLYRSSNFYWLKKPDKTTNLS
jgi:hypothetical protein